MSAASAPGPAVVEDAYWRSCERPERWQDWLLLGVAILGAVPFIGGNVVILFYRRRKFFRTEGVDLILGSSTAGLVWIASQFVVNQHFKRDRGSFFSICSLWTFWLQMSFGFCLWLTCLALRLYRLHVLATTDKPLSARRTWLLIVPVLLTPTFILSVVATAYHISQYKLDQDIEKCIVRTQGWKLASFLLLPPIYFSAIVILGALLKGQGDILLRREYRHMREYAISAFVTYLLTATIYWSSKEYNVYGRCFLTFCVSSLVYFHFWVRMGLPVYLCLFNTRAMDKYEDNLRRNGAKILDKLQSLPSGRNIGLSAARSSSFHFHLEDEFDYLIEAIATAKSENEMYKEKIWQLEQEKETLIRRNRHFQEQRLRPSDSAPDRLPVEEIPGGPLLVVSEITQMQKQPSQRRAPLHTQQSFRKAD